MVVFTRKYINQTTLKKRFFKKSKLPHLRFGTVGIYCLSSFRFEYRYCLFFRKFFKRFTKHRKRKVRTQHRRRTWLFVRPNITLTHKSKNARMGKGKGNFKRWATIVYPGRVFIEHLNISPLKYHRYIIKMRAKTKLFLYGVYKTKFSIKNPTIEGVFSRNVNKFMLLRTRKSNLLWFL
jgi:ribosomal protein L16/L10AE